MNWQFLDYIYFNNSVRQYFYALAAFVVILFGLWVFKAQVVKRLKKLAVKTKTKIDDLLVKILASAGWPIFYLLLSFYLALKFVNRPKIIDKIIYYLLLIIVTYLFLKTAGSLIEYTTKRVIEKKQKEDKTVDESMIRLLSKVLKILLWVVAAVLILSNFGYDVSALIAGLGIGGVAVAFAFQRILEDIFASFSIYFDKPFQVDDFIVIGTDMGTVKHIGIKTTRIQTLQGQELVISNKELTTARVNNYKKMSRRRIVFTFGVTYETPTEKLKKIPALVKKIIDNNKLTETDRVHFKEFADSSLNYEVVYYINSSEYNDYMDSQQEINLKIKEVFEKEKIEMAYPTQTIFVKK